MTELVRLSIVTWNLQGSKGVDAATVGGLLRQMTTGGDIQIVALQEVQPRHARALAKAWGATDWRWARKHLPYGPLLWWRAEGLAVLCNYDLDDHQITTLTSGVRLWSHRRRVLQAVHVDHPTRPVTVFNTHLASHNDADARAEQAAIVAGQIAQRRAQVQTVEVLTGDLNAPDEPSTLAPFTMIGLRDAWPAVRTEAGFTNPSGAPYQRLDYVLTSADVVVERAEVAPGPAAWPMLSDHLPLVVAARAQPMSATTPHS